MGLLRIVRPDDRAALASLLDRSTITAPEVEDAVRAIVADVRARGDAAVREYTERFDRRSPYASGDGDSYEVSAARWDELARQVAPKVALALDHAAQRIRAWHGRQVEPELDVEAEGVRLGLRVDPLARVGLYVPGGTARYPSSVLMTAIPAKVAGVGEIVMVTPGASPETMLAARLAGVHRVFEIGGAQAVAALAYGTATVPRVDKIVGPGNQWVAVAKRMVYGEVDIDSVAGPSEVLILADGAAEPAWIAADLIAQAEHDVEARAILVTTSQELVARVDAALAEQLETLPRQDIARAALANHGTAVIAANLDEAIEIANRYAPEHLELQVADARALSARLTTSGAIFLGRWASEATGDYLAGANHVLPTGGAARYASPLGVHDFRKRTSLIEYDEAAARAHAPDIEALADVEGLHGHGRSAMIRVPGARAAGRPRRRDSLASHRLAELVTRGLRGVTAYHVPRPVGIRARLDANELPYPLPDDVAQALAAELAAVPLHRYPPTDAGELRGVISKQLGVSPEWLVFGNGSDELISLLCATFGEPPVGRTRAACLYPTPTFVVYRIAAFGHHMDVVEVPLRDDFTLDEDAIAAAMTGERPNLAFFALPNNPTGTLWSPDYVLALARRHPSTIVVADEAYIDYGGQTLLSHVGVPPNLVVMRTLSKVGLAGLRCGYLVAHPLVVHEIEKVRAPYNLGSLPIRAATWLLTNHADLLRTRAKEVVAERGRVAAALRGLGVHVFDSEANLLMVKLPNASSVWQGLAARGVLVRNFDRPGPLAGCLRITIGTPQENDLLIDALTAVRAQIV